MYKKLKLVSSNINNWVIEIKDKSRNEKVNKRCLLLFLNSNNLCIFLTLQFNYLG